MPKPVETSGDPQEIIPVQVMMPRWMKNGLYERAVARGTNLSEMVKALILAELSKPLPAHLRGR